MNDKKHSPAVEISAGLCYNINRRECCQANGQHLLQHVNSTKNDRTSCRTLGGHFLLLKIFHAMSNMPKPTVASSVSRAKVSKSVMEHPPFRMWSVRGEQQKCVASPTRGRRGADRLPYVDSILRDQYNRRFALFQPGGSAFLFLDGWTFPPQNGYTANKINHGLHRRKDTFRGKL